MKVVILAAGMGARLGKPHPKALTLLANGRSIMQHQIKCFLRYLDLHDIYVVVGFKKELVMEAFPELTFIYNDYYDTTNTAKSLLRALPKLRGHDVLWINGDVVLDHLVIKKIIEKGHSCVAVNRAKVGEEEVKYSLNADGAINEISKSVKEAAGEAVGINLITSADSEAFINALEKCENDDYFEKGLEIMINRGARILPLDITGYDCIEVDFIEDLEKANAFLS